MGEEERCGRESEKSFLIINIINCTPSSLISTSLLIITIINYYKK